ncbi:MAG: aspartate/glutamate racemase family protein [Clostridia bacterium]|nr:aspartate/glutamate racemase family protein [Clostridia bacterium]
MNNGYIAVLDSGIGGFSFIAEAARLIKNEKFLYFGDNKNAPYGNKTQEELYLLTQKNLAIILKYDVKALVIACNTLSLSLMPALRQLLKIPIFGVFPPVNKKSGKTALFATPVTCACFAEEKGVKVFPLERLAADIEKNKINLAAVDIKKHICKAADAFAPDTVILGCTHYYFVKNQFIDHFCPQNIYSGESVAAKKLYRYLVLSGKLSKSKSFTIDFIGENAEENFNFYNLVVKDTVFNNNN